VHPASTVNTISNGKIRKRPTPLLQPWRRAWRYGNY